jgi:hypothetical protein
MVPGTSAVGAFTICRLPDEGGYGLCLIYDIPLARALYLLCSVAEHNLHQFDGYWRHQQNMLTDRCRLLGLPTLFLTIAPADG